MKDLLSLKQNILNKISKCENGNDLESLKVFVLGKKGQITLLLKSLKDESKEIKKERGKLLNIIKQEIISSINNKKEYFEKLKLDNAIKNDVFDVTLPIRNNFSGTLHPIQQTIEEAVAIFGEMGFSVEEGPDIEDDWHNFQALNIPSWHPARQMQDTFYMGSDINSNDNNPNMVLRTHTSPVQVRTMEKGNFPIRVIAPGRTYRSDSDITHTPMFHQIEGLVIDKTSNFSHLKGTLKIFIEKFFEKDDIPLRFRPSYFPFTEPSAEVDIGCKRDNNKLQIGNYNDWLEILGCGMVNPKVLKECNIDSDEYRGFAFGVGVERLAMLKYGISDLRMFFDSDKRWLDHYGFHPFDIPSLIRGL